MSKEAHPGERSTTAEARRPASSRAAPTVPEYQNRLAISHSNLANLLENLGRHVEAIAARGEAMETWQRLVTEFPIASVTITER